jgi:hypothetical protein
MSYAEEVGLQGLIQERLSWPQDESSLQLAITSELP